MRPTALPLFFLIVFNLGCASTHTVTEENREEKMPEIQERSAADQGQLMLMSRQTRTFDRLKISEEEVLVYRGGEQTSYPVEEVVHVQFIDSSKGLGRGALGGSLTLVGAAILRSSAESGLHSELRLITDIPVGLVAGAASGGLVGLITGYRTTYHIEIEEAPER